MTARRMTRMPLLLAIGLVGLFGCGSRLGTNQPDARTTSLELGNLGADDFKRALIGTWVSAYKYDSRRNVERLVINADGVAVVMVSQGESSEWYSGLWALSFERAPDPGMITFGSIEIAGGDKPITLNRVNFGDHNGVIGHSGPFLRIDGDSCGVLARDPEAQEEPGQLRVFGYREPAGRVRRPGPQGLNVGRDLTGAEVASANADLASVEKARKLQALTLLEGAGWGAKPCAAALGEALVDADSEVRARAMRCLRLAKLPPGRAERLIRQGLEDQSPEVMREAADHLISRLQAVDVPTNALISAMKRGDSQVRSYCAIALGQKESWPDEALPVLLGALQDPDKFVRLDALYALGMMGTGAPEAMRAAAGLVASEDKEVRLNALTVLLLMGSRERPSPPYVPVIVFGDKHALIRISPRYSASRAPGAKVFGPGAAGKECAPAVGAVLGDADPNVRSAALALLGGIGPGAAGELPRVQALFEDQEAAVRANAIWAACMIGAQVPQKPAERLVTLEAAGTYCGAAELLRALPADDPWVATQLLRLAEGQRADSRLGAAEVLAFRKHDPEVLVPLLARGLTDDSPDDRAKVLGMLAELGGRAEKALPQVQELLGSPDRCVRAEAAYAHFRISGHTDKALVVLMADLQSDGAAATSALEKMGKDAGPAAKVLEGMLADDDNQAPLGVARAHMAITGRKDLAVRRLVASLRSDDAWEKSAAARLLGDIGAPDALAAVPELQAVVADEQNAAPERREARKALVKIKGANP